jgi:hypothetical protein
VVDLDRADKADRESDAVIKTGLDLDVRFEAPESAGGEV